MGSETSAVMGRRVALVHDFLLDVRGAERVFAVMCDLFPEADVFTAVYDPVGTEGRFADREVHTSFLQRLRPTARTFRALLPAYPYAMESLDLSDYDLVLSSSSAWAHGVLVGEHAVHVCYCHNPFRYAWNARDETLRVGNPLQRLALRVVFHRWRQWDWDTGAPSRWHAVGAGQRLIVEGGGALSADNRAKADLGIWVETPDEVRKHRALQRDGDTYRPHWDRWAAQELDFIIRCDPIASADYVVTEAGGALVWAPGMR